MRPGKKGILTAASTIFKFTLYLEGYALGQQHHYALRPRVLFEDVTCTFLAGRRYAITGPNGAGKSTLMKILTGEIEPTKGSVTRPKKMGVLRQDQFAFDEFRVIDTVIMGNAPSVEGAGGARRAVRQAARRTDR